MSVNFWRPAAAVPSANSTGQLCRRVRHEGVGGGQRGSAHLARTLSTQAAALPAAGVASNVTTAH